MWGAWWEVVRGDVRGALGLVVRVSRLCRAGLLESSRGAGPDASREEVLAAAQAAQCDDILDKLPQGLETVVGAVEREGRQDRLRQRFDVCVRACMGEQEE